MKIELQSPFKEKWRFGYLVINKEPRRNIILYNVGDDRTTISYARYLMSVKLGYEIDENLEVDHINNDKMDDRLDNFQLLTKIENLLKSRIPSQYRNLICANCKINFTRIAKNINFKIKQGQINFCCSYSCSYEFQNKLRNAK